MLTDNFKTYFFADQYRTYSAYRFIGTAPTPQKEITLEKNDVLYIFPGCTIPRFKITELGKKIGFTTTLNSVKANKFIVSADYLSFDTNRIGYLVNREETIKFIIDNKHIASSSQVKVSEKLLLTSDDEVIIPSVSTGNYTSIPSKGRFRVNIDFEYVSKYDILVTTDPSKLYLDESLNALINGEKLMTVSDFKRFKNMFDSSDTSNYELACELMANFNFSSSASYLLILISLYGSNIMNCKVSSSVNFKNLLNFFSIDRSSLDKINLDAVISRLQKKYLYDPYHAGIVLDNYTSMKGLNIHSHFIADNIKFSDVAKELFGKSDTEIIDDGEDLNMNV